MMTDSARADAYGAVRARLDALLADETDWIAALATVTSELHHSFDYYDWTGFYRVVAPELLVIGPYQGTHGCLRIPFSRGICGAAARSGQTQLVPDVHARADHIACATTTQSEIVVPVLSAGRTLAVLDVDSNLPAAFTPLDQRELESLCRTLATRFPHGELPHSASDSS
jgi:L-methionine (R)-S-oxide reductase